MDSMSKENESGNEDKETSNSETGKRIYHRHSPQQIHHLEKFFEKCPHPDGKQQQELSEDLGLEPKQVKFWFRNKRIQIQDHAKRANNNVLKSENEKLHSENLAMKAALDNLVCLTCNIKEFEEVDRKRNLQKFRAENSWLKAEYKRLWNNVGPFLGKFTTVLSSPSAFETSSSKEKISGQEMALCVDQEQMKSPYQDTGTQEMEKSLMLDTATKALRELLELLQVNEPLWIKSDGRYFLDHDTYYKKFPKTDNSVNFGAWIESSKDSAIVPIPAAQLIKLFSDSKTWMNTFPTIVNKARTIGTIDTGRSGDSLHLMYAKLHILSPLVEPREYIFLRYSCQVDSNTWVMVDTSYKRFNKFEDVSLASWKLPSGCKIRKMPNGKSEVTWVEHVKVDGKSFNDLLFKELIWNCQAFGAKRWLATLERMCERIAFALASRNMTLNRLEGVTGAHESKRGLMDFSQKMVKKFCENLSTPKRIDVGHLAKVTNNDIQISVCENNGSSHPSGVTVCVATSLWLPIFCENLFDFFRDEKKRSQWDVFSGGCSFTGFGHIATGAHPGNCITLLKSVSPDGSIVTILQESYFDPLGGLVIYNPIHREAIVSAIRGEDTSTVPIFPSGFVISSNGHHHGEDEASTSSNINSSRGSILTMVFHTLMANITSKELSVENIDALHTVMSTTIAKVKAVTGCPSFH